MPPVTKFASAAGAQGVGAANPDVAIRVLGNMDLRSRFGSRAVSHQYGRPHLSVVGQECECEPSTLLSVAHFLI